MLAQALVASARRHSARAAVRYGGQTLTYEQLITQASAVAAELRRLADRMELPEDEPACGLLFNHGIQGIIGVVASVLAGLVYVPLDASYPPGRLSQIAWHSGIRIMVTDLDGLAAAEAIGSGLPFPEDIVRVDAHSIKPGSKAEIPEKVHKRLYLLYTSGSTGIPKGVVQQGASIVHFAEAYIRELGITADDRLTLFSTFGHDAAVVDIFAGLLSGACLYPLDLRIPENLLRLPGWLEGNGITVWHSVPSLFRTFFTSVRRLPQLPSLRLAVLGEKRYAQVITAFVPGDFRARSYTVSTDRPNPLIQPAISYPAPGMHQLWAYPSQARSCLSLAEKGASPLSLRGGA